jgi:sporulation protein YunB
MFGNRRRPRKGPLPFRNVFVISIVIFAILTAQGLWLINKGIRPAIMEIAVTRTEQIATESINDAISKKIVQSDLRNIEIYRENGEVSFDPETFTRTLSEVTLRVERFLKKAEQGKLDEWQNAEEIQVETGTDEPQEFGEIAKIPLGQATGIPLLANLGPEIPVRITPMGTVRTEIKTEWDEVGINWIPYRLYIQIVVDVRVIIPFETEIRTITNEIPLASGILKGDVPNFYSPGGGGGVQPTIPIDPEEEKINSEGN